jgi:hypothetical protein
MNTTLFVLLYAMASVAFVVTLFVAGTWIGRRLDARHTPVLVEVIVNTKRPDDQSVRGLADARAFRGLRARGPIVLKQAVVDPGGEALPAGDVTIFRDHVAWIQHL